MSIIENKTTRRRYSAEEKRQLVANLDIEVAHRTRQFEAWLADRLENFTIHQDTQVLRIPKQVRAMTMRDFGNKYEGNIQLALKGFQKERLADSGVDSTLGEMDKNMRKRKWVASQEIDVNGSDSSQPKDTDLHRLSKSARMQPISPKKVTGSSTGPGTAQRSRLLAAVNKTPSTLRTMGRVAPSPSPQKSRPPFNNTTATYNPRPPSRPASPVKHQPSNTNVVNNGQISRVPSASSFNPSISAKTPKFPLPKYDQSNTIMRLPRKDENMLSVNGSPLANPYEFGLGWFKGFEINQMETEDKEFQGEQDAQQSGLTAHTLKRSKSNIIIRRDPSAAFPSNSNGYHSRTDSQASFYTASSQDTPSSHSRENSQTVPLSPRVQATLGPFRFPSMQQNTHETTPRPATKHSRTFSALVAIPTKDGHFLEFDPLQTSPGSLDALEGISDSAKKHAKVEMGRLIQATVDKWKIL